MNLPYFLVCEKNEILLLLNYIFVSGQIPQCFHNSREPFSVFHEIPIIELKDLLPRVIIVLL